MKIYCPKCGWEPPPTDGRMILLVPIGTIPLSALYTARDILFNTFSYERRNFTNSLGDLDRKTARLCPDCAAKVSYWLRPAMIPVPAMAAA